MILAFLLAGLLAARPASSVAAASEPAILTPSGLRFETLKPGTGPAPTLADAVRVIYEGRLEDGTVFDRADAPVGLPVAGLVPGFTEALLLMRRGGTYRFRIPPQLAYGAEGAGGVIPPNATLVFTVTLIDIGRPVQLPVLPPPAVPQ
jgi:FKBP-type peptidyl-prolyl cis-trans isomerase FkpA